MSLADKPVAENLVSMIDKSFDDQEAREIIKPILNAVEYLHAVGIVHSGQSQCAFFKINC